MTENMTKHGRGRPKKLKLTDDEMFEDILFRAYNFSLDANGKLRIQRNNTPLTLEETAFMIWNLEGRKTAKLLSKMMIIKVERSGLEKIRAGLAKCGIKNFDDVYAERGRTCATKFGNSNSDVTKL